MHMLFYISVILFAGMGTAKILSKFKLPNVTGYLIAGLIIGPSLLGIIPKEASDKLSIISEAALSFIAYSIGSEFNIENLKRVGKGVILITVLEALTAVFLVDIVMIFVLGQPVAFSLVLGAIAAATAPAATLMVVRQYKAKGPVVDTLLPVVAMDDAVGIMAFGVSTTIAQTLVKNSGGISIAKIILIPLLEIVAALVIGFGMGIFLTYLSKKVKGEDGLLSIVIAILFATAGIAIRFNLSSLLACMMVGATLTNLDPNNKRAFTAVERFTPPVLISFFTIAGVQLDLSILKEVGLLGIVYIVVRVVGKMLGAYLGAKISDFPDTVQKYLGFTLIPQAGVAIGLSMIAQNTLPSPYGAQVRTIVLAATVIYELLGPMITKTALIKAGEIKLD
ncbi:cation:proton antiporter [Sporanaerobacter acetigenes]|uniref:Kef-type K+ transport system, membrane component KefB n=1 Tax=Sporanaerobacter acetigenes DSM 13106 TaxID=1123281 RepID=A0A1M5YXW9_9FIRM|nr:cation:proton antiporter [Sporanaerobacter acetigenes]SHI16835.1 Kef-type K+ transport system, membrane component KefB [Sporanaerobacter acetigenes DSM 13106]